MYMIILASLLWSMPSHAKFVEYVARCTEVGADPEESRFYSLHINADRTRGILVAVDTDKLTEVEYGSIKFEQSRKTGRTIKMPSADAVFEDVVGDPGGDARIRGKNYVCDFSQ